MKNYYTILGIKENATREEIKKAFRNLAVQYHPDKTGDDHTFHHFNEINEAQQVLLDDWKRNEYDMLLNNRERTSLFVSFFLSVRKAFSSVIPGSNSNQQNPNLKYGLIAVCTIVPAVLLVLLLTRSDEPAAGIVKNEIPIVNKVLPEVETPAVNPGETGAITTPDSSEYTSGYSTPVNTDTTAIVSGKESKPVIEAESIAKTTSPVSAATQPVPAVKKRGRAVKKAVAPNAPQTVAIDASVVRRKLPAPVASAPKSAKENEADLNIKTLTHQEMNDFLTTLIREEIRLNATSHCIQIRKAENSNVTNAFKLASFLQMRGYVISGRQTVKASVKGIAIQPNGGCISVTIGTF
jgi:hypothetical protein